MAFTDDNAEEQYNATLQQEVDRIRLYHAAVKSEFAQLDLDDPQTHKKVRAKVHELVPDACTTIANLLLHADSESVRAGLAKFVITMAAENAAVDKPKDYLEDLFSTLVNDDTDDVVDAEARELTE